MLLREVIFKLIKIKTYRWQSACKLSQIASINGERGIFQACPWNSVDFYVLIHLYNFQIPVAIYCSDFNCWLTSRDQPPYQFFVSVHQHSCSDVICLLSIRDESKGSGICTSTKAAKHPESCKLEHVNILGGYSQ